ncbi:hypothetical protein C2S52_015270 [Perilla frutescens var. hirtella]|nr:hypothetical protein C2S52_015270 [Perilla frutescens var. hirtella]
MSWSKFDEVVFVNFLRLRVVVDLSNIPDTAEVLHNLARLMSKARYRYFSTIELVIKSNELKQLFYFFKNFTKQPEINYTEKATVSDAYFNHFNDINYEYEMYKQFRLNGIPEYYGICGIVEIGGVMKLDFESLINTVA